MKKSLYIFQRLFDFILHDKELYVYHNPTEQGDILSLSMRWSEQTLPFMPVRVLQMPEEVPGNLNPVKKKEELQVIFFSFN